MNNVAVLMSTYNGSKYLREQIDSILKQEDVNIHLFIRDDGSKDDTTRIINEYINYNDNIHLIMGDNIGVGRSFMQLVYSVPNNYDYYAFSDQDDIWLPTKVKRAIDILKEKETALYCSNQTLVDCQGEIIAVRHVVEPSLAWEQTVCNNRLSGCTMVWTSNFQKIVAEKNRRPSNELLENRIHDVWFSAVAELIGEVYFDQKSLILYRQHEDNVVGVKKTKVAKQWMDKLRNRKLRNGRSKLCRELYTNFEDLIADNKTKEQLKLYAFYNQDTKMKLNMIRERELAKYSADSLIGLKLKIIMNLF